MNNCKDCGNCNLCGPFNFDKKKGNAALVNGIVALVLCLTGIIFLFIKEVYSLYLIVLSLFLCIIGLILAKKERKYYPRKINRYAIYVNGFSFVIDLLLGVLILMFK